VRDHHYRAGVAWTGNLGTGTSGYRDYSRDHDVALGDKPVLPGSADRAFRGDAARYNPEELLVAALSQCHLLAYLHLCATHGVVVTAYTDEATGTMSTTPDGGGSFREVTLHPRVTVSTVSDPALALRLHADAHATCFIANSVSFPVHHEPEIVVEPS
jgi:organic hydroperoxide reductase OsmC/OhrA